MKQLLALFLYCSCGIAAAAHDQTVPLPAFGQHAVACSNLAHDALRIPAGAATGDFWIGYQGRYVDQVLANPDKAVMYYVQPDDATLYPTTTGLGIAVVALVCYPTDNGNPDPDYLLPGTATTVPHMQTGDQPRIHTGLGALPLVVYSHGLYTSPVDLDREVVVRLASHGYMVFAPFHADARWGQTDLSTVGAKDLLHAFEIYREALEKITLRALQLKAGLEYLLQQSQYRERINLNQIAAIGTCFGAPPLLALAGARLGSALFGGNLIETPKETRFKTIVSLVPFSGTEIGLLRVPLYGVDQVGTSGVALPQFAVVGSLDTVSPPALTGAALTQSGGPFFTVALTGFNHKNWIEPGAAEVSAWVDIYLRGFLRGELSAYDSFMSMANIESGVDDRIVAARDPVYLPDAIPDALFDAAESLYPALLPPGVLSSHIGGYYARCYPTRYCLGSQGDTAYVFDGREIRAVGDLRELAQNLPTPP